MESKKLFFLTIIALLSVCQTVKAIECYECKFGETCTLIEEMQDKTICPSGWENCQTVTTEKKGKVVSVTGGCVPGTKKDEEHDCTTFDSSGTTICTCNEHLCNGVDLGTTTTTQKTTPTTQKTTTTTQKTTPTTQKTATTTQKTTPTTQKTTTTTEKTTPTTQKTTTTTQKTTPTTQKTTTTTQKTNGIERLEVAILETLVLIVFVSFVFY